MSRLLIIGYGNPLRGDDGFGPALAQRLQDESRDTAEIEIITAHQLTLEFAEPLSRTGRVIFIDASAGDAPGEIAFQKIEPAPAPWTQNPSTRFTHHLSPQTLMAYAQFLYGAQPSAAFLLTVCGAHFGLGDTLSAPVTDSFARALELLRTQIRADTA